MNTIAEEYFEFYENFKNKFQDELKSNNIEILSDFIKNKDNIYEFHKQYIEPNSPKIVICGMNPGRFGAGKTGIPFVDFNSLSQMLPNIEANDSEKSAKFIFSIIEHFGVNLFYQKFHVTNLSWYGFIINKRKNLNYNNNSINKEIQNILMDKFVDEMNYLNPKLIVPLSVDVYSKLVNLKKQHKISAEIAQRLNHPAWITTYKVKELTIWRDKYIETLSKYMNL